MPSSTRSAPKPLKKPPGLAKLAAKDVPPVTRVRAVKTGHNEYTVVEETFSGPPATSKVLAEKVDGTSAMYRCRLRAEELLGPNRLGGTGLE